MRALTYHGPTRVSVDEHPDPTVLDPRDAVLRVEGTCICGSDLHLYHGMVPKTRHGHILGHEFIGTVVEVGEKAQNPDPHPSRHGTLRIGNGGLNVGDRVVVPFPVACGDCENCRIGRFAACLVANNGRGAAIFGYSDTYGGLQGGQAEMVRVPYADIGPMRIAPGITDQQAVLLADILPTAYQAVAEAGVGPDTTVAVIGAGPVGLLAVQCAKQLLNAPKVIAVDRVEDRLALAQRIGADAVVNFERDDVVEAIKDETDGHGAHVTVDAVGFEASSPKRMASLTEKAIGALHLQTGSLTALRYAAESVRWGGAVSVPGVYATAPAQNFPWGTLWEKGVHMTMGQTHVHAHLPMLMEAVASGRIDPSVIISHEGRLDEAPDYYKLFTDKEEGCTKVFLRP